MVIEAIAAPVELASAGKDVYYTGNFTIQVGAFKNHENAERLRQRLSATCKNVHIVTYTEGTETFYRVRVGTATSLDEAAKMGAAMEKQGFTDAFVVAE